MIYPVNRNIYDLTPEELLGFYEASEGDDRKPLREELLRRMKTTVPLSTGHQWLVNQGSLQR